MCIPNSIPYTSSRSDDAAIEHFGRGDQPVFDLRVKLFPGPVNVNVDMLLCSSPGLYVCFSISLFYTRI